MAETEVPVLCYWNGRIEYGSNGVYYDISTPRMIKVNRKAELIRLLDQLYLLTGLDINERKSKIKIVRRYPSVDQQSTMFQFLLLPVVNDSSLQTMLDVPSRHPSIKNVELYLEVMFSLILLLVFRCLQIPVAPRKDRRPIYLLSWRRVTVTVGLMMKKMLALETVEMLNIARNFGEHFFQDSGFLLTFSKES